MNERTLRNLPSVDQLLESVELTDEISEISRVLVAVQVREVLAHARKTAKKSIDVPSTNQIILQVKSLCRQLARRRITRVLNGTGVMIHTNLGRSPLGNELLKRASERIAGYSTLEFDLETGKRGRRGAFLSFLLASLTGADSALAVNNNAAALFLILNTFANKREVIVSRSELVQIGGGFRIPDIIRRAGSKLVEVGTTNQTSLRDYREAISEKTALLLKVHRSNFHLSGFVDEVSPEKLAELAAKKKLLSIYDLGSGSYHQTEKFGMEMEPNITSALRTKSSLVCFSGDKLLGSTQAGIIVGDADLTTKLHENPIYRVVRLDKVSLVLLEESVIAYLRKEDADVIALWKQIRTPKLELRERAEKLKTDLGSRGITVDVRDSLATPGGGSLPGGSLESVAIVLKPAQTSTELNRVLLDSTPPLIGYIEKNELLLDLRTIDPSEDRELVGVLESAKECLQ